MSTYIPKRVKFASPLIGKVEKSAVQEVLSHRQLTNGGQVRAFEEKFQSVIGGGFCSAVSSCTAGLYMGLKALHVGPGDEVILPAQTFVACAHVIEAVGAIPIFVDSWEDSGVMDPELVEKVITKQTKAIMAVHYAGRPCYMGTIMDIARRHNLKVIEDCATALGAFHSGKHVGLIGDIGVFSFHPVKHITTCEGGMVVTRHPDLHKTIVLMREFGKVNDGPYAEMTAEYDVISFGLNFRMSEIQGAIGLHQLDSLPKRILQRKSNYIKLANALSGFDILDLGVDHASFYCMVLRLPVNQREARQELTRRDIETSVYYPGPIPMLTYYRKKYGFNEGDFPIAERISKEGIALPVGPHLQECHMRSVADALKDICRRAA